MPTLYLKVNPKGMTEPESLAALEQAASILRAGGTVALPTETVYGLGANALDEAAVAAIFRAKQRPHWDPLIVHISDDQMLADLVTEIPVAARKLMEAFWPGPLTLLLPRSEKVPDAVTAGRKLVGVRMPRHLVALALIRMAGVPIAAPSANTFGHTSPTNAQHVLDDLDGRVDAVVDAGPTDFGVESTVLDVTVSPMVIYRPGAVTIEQIRVIAGPVEMFSEPVRLASEPREAMPSPGVGLRHYAPRARLILVDCGSDEDAVHARLLEKVKQYQDEGVGILWPGKLPGHVLQNTGLFGVYSWGRWQDLDELATRLFAGLRSLDDEGYAVILCPVPPAEGIGMAIRDRLQKAAFQEDDQCYKQEGKQANNREDKQDR